MIDQPTKIFTCVVENKYKFKIIYDIIQDIEEVTNENK